MNNIKYYRKNKGLTLLELSNISGLSIGYLCHLEHGTKNNPSYKTMKTIALCLDKEIQDIFK